MLSSKKHNAAFTIVELLIVVVIIGILATITFLSYRGIVRQAETTGLKSDLSGAAKQLEIEKTLYGIYPDSLAQANNNNGLKYSSTTTMFYSKLGNGYCVSASYATDPTLSFKISSDTNILTEGSCLNSWKTVEAGASTTCGINFNNETYCWGDNEFGQVGIGSYTSTYLPTRISQGAIPTGVYLVSVKPGDSHTCGVGSDGNAYCWGANYYGQLGNGGSPTYSNVPVVVSQGARPAGVTFKMVSSGTDFSCGIGSDNATYCWGYNSDGQLGDNSVTTRTTPVSINQGAISGGVTAKQIYAGAFFVCMVGTNDKVYCWGDNVIGQIGNNSTSDVRVPTAVLQGAMPANYTVSSLAIGGYHVCVIASDNNTYCWGYNGPGQLGNGTNTDSRVPVLVSKGEIPAGVSLVSLNNGWYFSCGIASNDEVYCWGNNSFHELGVNTVGSSNTPVRVTSIALPDNFVAQSISSGGVAHSCAIGKADGVVYCWGDDMLGQLGIGTTKNKNSPTSVSQGAIPNGVTALTIANGSFHSCMLGSNGKAYCWGSGNRSQLGNGSTQESNVPVEVSQGAVPGGATFSWLDVGWDYACGLGSDSWAYCWGLNSSGQLGNGNTTAQSTPVAIARGAIPAGIYIKKLSLAGETTCAIGTDDKLYCWGASYYGQLGNGTTTAVSSPIAVSQGAIPGGTAITDVDGGGYHFCATGSNNVAYCWGYNYAGQLGDNSQTNRNTPVAVVQGSIPGGITIKNISAGDDHTCAIGTNNLMYCWGRNLYGQIGVSSVGYSRTPLAVQQGSIPGGSTIKQVYAGRAKTCAIASNDLAYCWGSDAEGNLGTGSWIGLTNSPKLVVNGDNSAGTMKYVAPGFLHTCGIGTDNKPYCWGSDYRGGLLGDGVPTFDDVPRTLYFM